MELKANFTDDPEKFYSRSTICNNHLQPNEDFQWTIDRTSYALEWGLICSDEHKGSDLQSSFFIGGLIGDIVGTVLLDTMGRRTTCLIGLAITSLASVATSFLNSYSMMLPMIVVQGVGSFLAVSGIELLSIEFTPSNLRNLSQILATSAWDVGALLIVGISYGVRRWRSIYLVQGCVLASTAIAVFMYPESPRFQLVKGRVQEARATFRKLSKIFKTRDISENLKLTYQDYNKNFFGQIADLRRNSLMLRNTVVLMACDLLMSCISYGLLFSWSKLGANIYASVAITALGDFIAKGSGITYYMIHCFGRKKALMINYAGSASLFLLSIPCYGVQLTDSWNLGQVVCLLVTLCNGSIWVSKSLLTKEVSPTSHRGMIMCLCSAAGKIGAVIGPYMALLYNTVDNGIVLSLFGGMAAFACFLTYFCSDSTGRAIPSTPDDLTDLYSEFGYQKLVDEDAIS